MYAYVCACVRVCVCIIKYIISITINICKVNNIIQFFDKATEMCLHLDHEKIISIMLMITMMITVIVLGGLPNSILNKFTKNQSINILNVNNTCIIFYVFCNRFVASCVSSWLWTLLTDCE